LSFVFSFCCSSIINGIVTPDTIVYIHYHIDRFVQLIGGSDHDKYGKIVIDHAAGSGH